MKLLDMDYMFLERAFFKGSNYFGASFLILCMKSLNFFRDFFYQKLVCVYSMYFILSNAEVEKQPFYSLYSHQILFLYIWFSCLWLCSISHLYVLLWTFYYPLMHFEPPLYETVLYKYISAWTYLFNNNRWRQTHPRVSDT